MASSRAVIVGGGIVGVLSALELHARGFGVTVVEERDFGGQATVAAAGMLAPWTELRGTGAFAFAVRSLEAYPALCRRLFEETALDPGYASGGIFEVALSAEEARGLKALAGEGDSVWLEPAELGRAVPVASHDLFGALHWRREAHVQSPNLIRAAVRLAAMSGIELRAGERVLEILETGGRATGVRSTAGLVEGDVVVLAAGAWSEALAATAGLVVPVVPVRGQVLAMEDDRARLRQVLFGSCGYLTPKSDGTLIVGATEDEAGYRAGVTANGLAVLSQVLPKLAPELGNLRFLKGWSGFRPKTPDALPIIGPAPGLEGLVVGTGHFRNGILMAPATARAVADLVTSKVTNLPIDGFAPGRFAEGAAAPR